MNQQSGPGGKDYYRSLFDISPTSIIVEDGEGTILDVNPAFCRIFGYSREEVIGRPIDILGLSNSSSSIREHIKQILSGRVLRHVVKNRRKDGRECYLDLNETRITLPGGRGGVLAVANDITEQVESTQALQESEGRLSGILSSMIDLVFAFDEEGRFTFYHAPEGAPLLSPPEQFLGRRHDEVMPPGVEEPFRRAFQECKRGQAVTYTYSLDIESGPRWFSCQLSPIILEGIFRGAVAVVADITEQRKTEEALRLHSLVYRSIEEAVLVFDRTGRCIDMNPAAERMTGWEKREFVGRRAELLNPPGRAAEITGEINEALGRKGFWQGELPLITRTGELRTMYTVVSCLKNNGGEWMGNIGINRDITEQKKIELELNRAHKLESLGVLAGGLAHDFNNLLMAVMGNASLLKGTVPGEGTELLEEIERACLQAQGLTRQLLTFARGGAPAKKPVNLASVVEEAVGLALRGTASGCRFACRPGLSWVEGDPGQLSQVFNNLLINAAQAMPGGGRIKVEARDLGPAEVPPHLPPGSYVLVTIADEGEGIDPENLAKIFDPFFTTKPQGTGLGLTVSYSIVRNHGGTITIESVPGEGCLASVYLPAAASPPGESGETPAGLIRGRGRILVIDDEDTVVRVTRRLLQRLGYRCETAPEGGRAVELYRAAAAAGDPFDLVIADLTVVGGLGGKETAARLKLIDPEARILVASGYSNDPVMADYARYGFCGMLAKPYELASLSRELSRVLAPEKPGRDNGA